MMDSSSCDNCGKKVDQEKTHPVHYPLFMNIRDRVVVVFGGGSVAQTKIGQLLAAGALITVVSPCLSSRCKAWHDVGQIQWKEDPYQPGCLNGAILAFAATSDPAVNRQILEEGRQLGIPVHVCDDWQSGDFINGAWLLKQPLSLCVSTGGTHPRVARMLRDYFGNDPVLNRIGPLIQTIAERRTNGRRTMQASSEDRQELDRLLAELSNILEAGHAPRRLAVVRGCGDIGSGALYRLRQCGFHVVGLDVAEPTVIRRQVAFAQAIYDGSMVIEGIEALRAERVEEVAELAAAGKIPILVDPKAHSLSVLRPDIVIDAILAKKNLGTCREMAPVVIGLGPGFEAGRDVHAVIETNRGHNLGRVIYAGCAADDTGTPGEIGGFGRERILRAPVAGKVRGVTAIGDRVTKGQAIAYVEDCPVVAAISGVLRGLIQEGITVPCGTKIGDIDPRCDPQYCRIISDKSLAIAGGVLEAVMHL